MLKIGLIGAGAIAQNAHVPALAGKEDIEVAAVADVAQANRREAGERLGCARLYDDYRRLLDEPDIQAVDVCLPHFLHEEVTLAALDAGKSVLLEKPIALTLEQADRMIAAARDKKRKFFVSLNQRFEPAHRKLKEILESGVYGRPFLVLAPVIGDEFSRMNIEDNWKGRWDRAGGGALVDTGTHIIDLMLWWFGRPKTVSCQYGRFRVQHDCKGDDNICVVLGYEDMLANITVTYTARSDPWTEHKHVYFPGDSVHVTLDPVRPVLHGKDKQPPEPLDLDEPVAGLGGSVTLSVRHFLDCIQGKAQPAYGPEAARDALEVILAAYRSADEARTINL